MKLLRPPHHAPSSSLPPTLESATGLSRRSSLLLLFSRRRFCAMSEALPATAHTPPTPSRTLQIHTSAARSSSAKRVPRGLQLLPLSGANGSTPPIAPMSAAGPPELCTPVEVQEHHTPPPELRRESLIVPPSEKMFRMAQGSGVSVYRMDRSPREGRPRSPWVLKKANVSPLLVRTPPPPASTRTTPRAQSTRARTRHTPRAPPRAVSQ